MKVQAKLNKKIQAVIFDLDGVLIDSELMAFRVWQEITTSHGGRLEDNSFGGMIGLSQEDTAAYVMEKSGARFDVKATCELAWQQIMERLKTEIAPLPGVTALLSCLKAQGIRTAIASNSFLGYIDNALAGLQMEAYFPVRVGIDQVANGKPAPDVYLCAAKRLGVAPERCAAIEDSRVGVQAAAAAGMRVIAIPDRRDPDHGSGYENAWRIYPSLIEVEQELEQVLGR